LELRFEDSNEMSLRTNRRVLVVMLTVVAPGAGLGIAACSSGSSSGDDSSIAADSGGSKDSTVADTGPKSPNEAGVDAAPKQYCAADSVIIDAGPDGDAGPPATPQSFDSTMTGCPGAVMFNESQSLCAPSCKVCSTEDWINHHGTALPAFNYWTSDNLGFDGNTLANFGNGKACGASPYGLDGSTGPTDNPGLCENFSLPDGGSIPSGMHVCYSDPNEPYAIEQADRFGNTCYWVRCAFSLDGSVPPPPPLTPDGQAPPQYDSLGGCTGDFTAGALCCCE
jgi:hypothetical protein